MKFFKFLKRKYWNSRKLSFCRIRYVFYHDPDTVLYGRYSGRISGTTVGCYRITIPSMGPQNIFWVYNGFPSDIWPAS
jgi:hypothetical protein